MVEGSFGSVIVEEILILLNVMWAANTQVLLMKCSCVNYWFDYLLSFCTEYFVVLFYWNWLSDKIHTACFARIISVFFHHSKTFFCVCVFICHRTHILCPVLHTYRAWYIWHFIVIIPFWIICFYKCTCREIGSVQLRSFINARVKNRVVVHVMVCCERLL